MVAHTEAGWPAVADCFRALCIGVNTPVSLKGYLLLKYKEYDQLARMRIDPLWYNDSYSFSGDYAVCNFLKKNADLPLRLDRKSVAIAAFKSSEDLCKETNERIEGYLSGSIKIPARVNEIIHLASRKIGYLLKSGPSLYTGPYHWGPGATTDLRRQEAYLDTKITTLPLCVSGNAAKAAARLLLDDLHWRHAIVASNPNHTGPIIKIVPGGRVDTVPKTVLTDRTILVEPRLNTVLQKRMGLQLRGLLKRVNVDLDDQGTNQSLAEMANALDLATLDLEAASDSVSRKVVELLLPEPWVRQLDELRSPWYQLPDGSWHRFEKFSSMGNGFTFELESLIFWSLTAACSELYGSTIFGIYGDDIILHRGAAPDLIEVLSFLGFKLNNQKSFLDGLFFESCGRHFFDGKEVTPIYQKINPTDKVEAARMGNRILRLARRLGYGCFLDKRLQPAWNNWFRHWKVDPSQCGPFLGEGDGYWETERSQWSHRSRSGPFGPGVRVACYSAVQREIPANDDAMYAARLMAKASTDHFDREGPDSQRAPPLGDPSVTITLRGKTAEVIQNRTSIGMIDSRVKQTYCLRHRLVYEQPQSDLTW